MNPNKFHMSGTYFEGGVLNAINQKRFWKFFTLPLSPFYLYNTWQREWIRLKWCISIGPHSNQFFFFLSYLKNADFWYSLEYPINCFLCRNMLQKAYVHLRQLREKKNVWGVVNFDMKFLKQYLYVYYIILTY